MESTNTHQNVISCLSIRHNLNSEFRVTSAAKWKYIFKEPLIFDFAIVTMPLFFLVQVDATHTKGKVTTHSNLIMHL